MRQHPDPDDFNDSTGWNHKYLCELLSLRAQARRSSDAEVDWSTAKQAASILTRQASRASGNPTYHADLAYAAAVRRAEAEIAKHRARMNAAEAELQRIQTAAPKKTRNATADDLLLQAQDAKAAATRAQEEARRLRMTPTMRRRQLELESIFRRRGIDPSPAQITLEQDESGEKHRWTYWADEHGTVWRTDDPADLITNT